MEDKVVGSNKKLNLVPGFETYLGNYRVVKRMMAEMGVEATLLSDPSEVLDTPAERFAALPDAGVTTVEVSAADDGAPEALAMAYLTASAADRIRGGDHDGLAIDIRGSAEPADLVPLPFYRRPRRT